LLGAARSRGVDEGDGPRCCGQGIFAYFLFLKKVGEKAVSLIFYYAMRRHQYEYYNLGGRLNKSASFFLIKPKRNTNDMDLNSCGWPGEHKLAIAYHDNEWGVPVHDDHKHFEFLVLDAFQAGLSWNTILNKRENFRQAFDNFDYTIIANYGQNKVDELMNDAGIIRNKSKILATITNAKAFMEVIKEYGSFDKYIWSFVNGKPVVNELNSLGSAPARTPLSDNMSKGLTKRGFKFVGSTICYAYMQAAGLVNDHLVSCHRYKEVQKYY
jgi:DNA-3-methyladenine glycosylase I